jgi:hypothetical protein
MLNLSWQVPAFICCNNEFGIDKIKAWSIGKGTKLEPTNPYLPWQNGIEECSNSIILECTCALLYEYELPYWLWEDAMEHAIFVTNNVPTSTTLYTDKVTLGGVSTNIEVQPSLHIILYLVLINKPPRIAYSCPFGCIVNYYNNLGHNIYNKLLKCASKGIYIGSNLPVNH